jgi:hypothetical protein
MKLNGGCFCGEVRFEIEEPSMPACFCHCNSCQRAAGAPLVAWATVKKSDLSVQKGAISWHQSSPGVTRGHCANCGTCLTYEHEKEAGYIDVTLNSLDDPSALSPKAHIWVEDKQPWLIIGDDLPQFQQRVIHV